MMVRRLTTLEPAVEPGSLTTADEVPWVADLEGSAGPTDCQSTVGFDDQPCDGAPAWYVQLELWGQVAANPRWEGKLCNPCLAGWQEWAAEEPDSVNVVSVHPIRSGD